MADLSGATGAGPTNGAAESSQQQELDDGSELAPPEPAPPPPTGTGRRRTWTMTLDEEPRRDSLAPEAAEAHATSASAEQQQHFYWRKWEECQDRHDHNEKKQRLEQLFPLHFDQQDDEQFARPTPDKVELSDPRQDECDLLLATYDTPLSNNIANNNQTLQNDFATLDNLILKMAPLEKAPVTGLRQSPIDIKSSSLQSARTSHAQQSDESESEIIPALSIDYSPITGATGLALENTGNGWKLNIPDEIALQCPISGGPLGCDEYRLLQVHCHWGKDSSCGSEHTLDGRAFPCEIHLVHWNATKYADPLEAMECSSDGLAVVGVFVQFPINESDPPNATLDVIIRSLEQIPFRDDIVPLHDSAELDLNALIPGRSEGPKYWSYPGSLTTPPYSESVIWLVMEQAIEAQEEQIAQFRQMNQNACSSDEIALLEENFREAQPLHNRNIEYYS